MNFPDLLGKSMQDIVRDVRAWKKDNPDETVVRVDEEQMAALFDADARAKVWIQDGGIPSPDTVLLSDRQRSSYYGLGEVLGFLGLNWVLKRDGTNGRYVRQKLQTPEGFEYLTMHELDGQVYISTHADPMTESFSVNAELARSVFAAFLREDINE